ncbi:hypothetical protein [Amycolatopsis sp. NPDC051372]|uniref:hypothetical protein n=1 Tax=Amycolatopsis sp. NPDC051372 TaxID=3155669 RepID=UPI0034453183
MPAVDLVTLIRQLPAESRLAQQETDGWGPDQENQARLVDLAYYQVERAYIAANTDPEDPELRYQRAEAKRRGIKPPPAPIIAPVALRPARVAERMWAEYHAEVEKYSIPDDRPQGTLIPLSEYERARGIVTEYQ